MESLSKEIIDVANLIEKDPYEQGMVPTPEKLSIFKPGAEYRWHLVRSAARILIALKRLDQDGCNPDQLSMDLKSKSDEI